MIGTLKVVSRTPSTKKISTTKQGGLSVNFILYHIAEDHVEKIKCKSCDKTFLRKCDLEVHIKAEHEMTEKYKCKQCEKTFFLKWRLLKHQSNHSNLVINMCHYFNNNLACPFEEIGCMFAHEVSEICKFGQECKNNLCSYQHSSLKNKPDPEPEGKDRNEKQVATENQSEEQECPFCYETLPCPWQCASAC